MIIIKFFAEVFLALPIVAFGAGNGNNVSEQLALSGYGHNKVKICHKGQTIEVSASSLASHLMHGDKLGKCPKKIDKDDDKDHKDDKDDKKDDKKDEKKDNKSENENKGKKN